MLNRWPATLCLVVVAALCAAAPVGAKNIYKYQDENGIWHFTDRAPDDAEIEFETVYMEREREARVRMRQEGTKQNPLYYLFNDYWGPVQVELKLSDAINVLSEPELPARFIIPGQEEQLLVGLGALDPQRGFRYRLNVATAKGIETHAIGASTDEEREREAQRRREEQEKIFRAASASAAVVGGLLFTVLNRLINARGGFMRKASTTLTYLKDRELRARRRELAHFGLAELIDIDRGRHEDTLPSAFADGQKH